jgi:hypothetical protein
MVPLPLAAQEVHRERLWSIPQEGIGRPNVTGSIGRFEKDALGSYNIYAKNRWIRGSLRQRGNRGLEIGPQRPGRR